MIDVELGAVQERFADIVWDNEPIASGELVKLCEKELRWKKPTTYTVLRKLCEKGLLKNENGIVTSLISKEDFYSAKSEQIVVDSYRGSLPAFIAAFISRNRCVVLHVNSPFQKLRNHNRHNKNGMPLLQKQHASYPRQSCRS